VKHALARERASLRSGARALLTARPTPAPAPAQQFDIESWEPTSDELVRLQAVRPDLDAEVIGEQLTAFRVWARSKDLKFRDAAECVRRLAGFVRLAHTPRRAASPKGSAGAERASSAKPSKATKNARIEQGHAVSMEELEQLAKQAGGYRITVMDQNPDSLVLMSPDHIAQFGETDPAEAWNRYTQREAAIFLQRHIDRSKRAANGKGKGKGKRPATSQLPERGNGRANEPSLGELQSLGDSVGCRVKPVPGTNLFEIEALNPTLRGFSAITKSPFGSLDYLQLLQLAEQAGGYQVTLNGGSLSRVVLTHPAKIGLAKSDETPERESRDAAKFLQLQIDAKRASTTPAAANSEREDSR
jgi:hypothetical protein